MDPRRQGSRGMDAAWLLFWAVASSVWCLTASTHLSSTFDEPFYLEHGMTAWRTGSNERLLKAGTMPLPVHVQCMPLYVWERCRGRALDLATESDAMLTVARSANLVFWWLLLFYGFRLGNVHGGPWGGRLAVMLLALEPNLLAHAGLATMDISVTACLLAFVYHFEIGRDGAWLRRVGIPGFWYGVAILAKASAFAFVPVAMFALEHYRQWLALRQSQKTSSGTSSSCLASLLDYRSTASFFPRDFWKIVGLGMLLTFVYCGSDWKQERSFVAWADKLPASTGKDAMKVLAENLRIFPNAGSGLAYQIKHNIRGHGAYLFGEWSPRAVSYYFPCALLIKLSVPILALVATLLLLRQRALATPLGILVLVLIGFSITCRVQIGIRLVLPLVAFLMVALAVGLIRSMPEGYSLRSFRLAVIGLAALLAIPPLSVWPDGIRYINHAWGGTEMGHRHLSDSNCDWGQGLKELAEWKKRNGDPPMKVWYYGKDPAFVRSPENCPLHNAPIESTSDFLRMVEGHYFAVSTSILYRDPKFTPQSELIFQVLHGMKPHARTSTFFIYDFTAKP